MTDIGDKLNKFRLLKKFIFETPGIIINEDQKKALEENLVTSIKNSNPKLNDTDIRHIEWLLEESEKPWHDKKSVNLVDAELDKRLKIFDEIISTNQKVFSYKCASKSDEIEKALAEYKKTYNKIYEEDGIFTKSCRKKLTKIQDGDPDYLGLESSQMSKSKPIEDWHKELKNANSTIDEISTKFYSLKKGFSDKNTDSEEITGILRLQPIIARSNNYVKNFLDNLEYTYLGKLREEFVKENTIQIINSANINETVAVIGNFENIVDGIIKTKNKFANTKPTVTIDGSFSDIYTGKGGAEINVSREILSDYSVTDITPYYREKEDYRKPAPLPFQRVDIISGGNDKITVTQAVSVITNKNGSDEVIVFDGSIVKVKDPAHSKIIVARPYDVCGIHTAPFTNIDRVQFYNNGKDTYVEFYHSDGTLSNKPHPIVVLSGVQANNKEELFKYFDGMENALREAQIGCSGINSGKPTLCYGVNYDDSIKKNIKLHDTILDTEYKNIADLVKDANKILGNPELTDSVGNPWKAPKKGVVKE